MKRNIIVKAGETMYRVAICEDELCQRQELHALCSSILTQLGIAHEISPFESTGEVASSLNNGARYDLICLDIFMDGQNGMEFASELRRYDEQTSIIFITCSKDYLLEGYSVRPIQYLLKPVSGKELEKAIRTDLRLNHRPRTICLKAKGTSNILPLDEICYVESRNHGSLFFMAEGEQFFQMNLTEVETLLPAVQFSRCHNSFLVNLAQIKSVNSRELLLINGTALPIGRRYGKAFQSNFIRHLNLNEV